MRARGWAANGDSRAGAAADDDRGVHIVAPARGGDSGAVRVKGYM